MTERTHTRRTVLSGLSAAGVIGSTTAAGMAGPAPNDEAVETLWKRYLALVVEAKAIHVAIADAEASLPHWARSGQRRVDWEGNFTDGHSGWPIREDISFPEDPGIWRLARPGPEDILHWFEEAVRIRPEHRDIARARYRKNMRALIKRVREQRIELDQAGLPGLHTADEENYEKRWAIECKIEAAPPSANGAAALLLLDWGDRCGENSSLRHLQPLLTGLVAQHVVTVLAGDVEKADLPFLV